MFRRGSVLGVEAIVAALACLFIPLAAASNSDRATQTLTLVVLIFALIGFAVAWLVSRQRGIVRRAHYLGLAALAGALVAIPLRRLPPFASATDPDLSARLAIFAALDAAGLWLFVVGLRRALPRYARGMAASAVTLVAIAVLPAPLLLLQPGTLSLNIQDAGAQLRAGFLFWTVGATVLVMPFLALLTISGDWFERWWSRTAAYVVAIPDRVFIAALLALALGVTCFFSFYSFERNPTTADEIAQLWHARMLISGALAMPPDPNPEFFAIDNVIDRPVWMSQFPIGGPAFLAVGLLLGAAWLVNPVLTALTALNVYRFGQRAYGEPLGRAAAIVFIASPMVVILGATHMNHTATAWLVTLALATLPVWFASTDLARMRRSAATIGFCIGAAMMVRPLDGFVAGVVFGLLMLNRAWRDRARARSLLAGVAAFSVPVLMLLLVNWRTTGHPLRFGYEVLWGANHSIGLHDDPTGNPHTPWRAFLLAVKYASQLNWIGTMWPVPVMLVIAVGLVAFRRASRWDSLLLALCAAQLAVYAFYWHDGQFVGPRFLFTVLPAVLLLATRAPFVVSDRPGLPRVWRRVAIATIPVCIAVTWFRAMQPFGVQAVAKEFRESRARLKVDPPREIERGLVEGALVFVQEGASARLQHRLWGLGVSRPDAARLLAVADACSLLEAIRSEERRASADSAGRTARIERLIRPFVASTRNPRVPDHRFRLNDTTSITPACSDEIRRDLRVQNTVAYGPMLLENRFDAAGQVAGRAVYVMDLGERNELLRARFRDRRWFRYELPRNRPDTNPILVPYDAPR